jgi:YggT family protein
MNRDPESRGRTGERARREGRVRPADTPPNVRYETVDGAGRPPQPDELEPNRVDVERRTGVDRRVADHPVEVDNRVADRRAAELQAREDARERRYYVVGRVTQGVDYLFYLLYGLLATRFVLSLLGASEGAGFVQFIQGITNPFYAPFANIVARPAVNGGVLDFPLLIAILAYALLHLAVRGMLRIMAGARATP